MVRYAIDALSFSYPNGARALRDISLTVRDGEFIVLCGPTGCGKTTLLHHLKPELTPHGVKSGAVLWGDQPLHELPARDTAADIGFVMQHPDNQIVTDKVWHELAFGLEGLGLPPDDIRRRVAEMAGFFGIEKWFHRSTDSLSGGQKQLLNLASVLAMQPRVLLLDEPTAQLDPVAAADFLSILGRIHDEWGTTIILSEHRLEQAFTLCDRVVVLNGGQIAAQGTPAEVGGALLAQHHPMFRTMPTPMRIWGAVGGNPPCPVSIRDGRAWLSSYAQEHPLQPLPGEQTHTYAGEPVVSCHDVYFRYEKDDPDVLRGLSLSAHAGECVAVLGGNGSGKTTLLTLLAGVRKPYRGRVAADGSVGYLPQNPQVLFARATVADDLADALPAGLPLGERQQRLDSIAARCRLTALLDRHPFDLSGGEQGRVGLAKVLLTQPRTLLLDEPTRGMDGDSKRLFAALLHELLDDGVAVVIVSHDVEFCARHAHRCALLFDGGITAQGTPRRFFAGGSFYTTAANRMARHLLPDAVTALDVITACGHEPPPEPPDDPPPDEPSGNPPDEAEYLEPPAPSARKQRLSLRTVVSVAAVVLAIPLVIWLGLRWDDGDHYYATSMLIVVLAMIPFVLLFEARRPQARELLLVAVLCGIGVAGRAAFFMLPQVKPLAAVVIIAGVAFGAQTGFLVGALTALVSNFFFGQGPWTPWQMLGFGLVGWLAGLLFYKRPLRRLPLCIYGCLSVFIVYGGLLNLSSALLFTAGEPTWGSVLSVYIAGIPFDAVHAAATVLFLWLGARPLLNILTRVRRKYGLLT